MMTLEVKSIDSTNYLNALDGFLKKFTFASSGREAKGLRCEVPLSAV